MRVLFAALLLIGAAAADEMTWETNLDVARERARKDGKPLLVVFR